jgi:aromatic-L-amino-acid decarboxylase
MSTNPTYLQSHVDGRVRNLRDTGIPLGRRFRALKLWFVLREQGISGLQSRLRRDLDLAQSLAVKIALEPHWHVIAPVVLQTVCVRFEPPGISKEQIDQFTRDWADAVNASGTAYVTPAAVDGRWMVRVSIGTPLTEAADIQMLWSAMQAATAEVSISYQ